VTDGDAGGAAGTLKIDAAHAIPADLNVEILDRAKDDQTFVFKLSSPWLTDLRKPVEKEWRLPAKAAELVDGLMKEFTARGVDLSSRLLSLRGAGKTLWKQAAPPEFQDAYWGLVELPRPPETILVVSEERNIPWELMIPVRKGSSDFRPLGVRASIARWFESTELRSPGTPMHDARVVAGNHTPPPNPLKNADAESSWICEQIGGSPITPATPVEVEAKITKWQGTLLHFVCHGVNAIPQALLLDGAERLTSTQVEGMLELETVWSENAPVVFLNACEVGRAAPSLGGVGGLAKAWADAGAGAVVAPLWSVRDSVAHDVALRFYKAVQAEPRTPYARIVRDIRALAYLGAGGEDTYAAYCYFGSPTAAAQMEPSGPGSEI
jgi:CHAT domain